MDKSDTASTMHLKSKNLTVDVQLANTGHSIVTRQQSISEAQSAISAWVLSQTSAADVKTASTSSVAGKTNVCKTNSGKQFFYMSHVY